MWQCNMAVLDEKEQTVTGAVYTNSAAWRDGSSGTRGVEASTGCRGDVAWGIIVALLGHLALILIPHAWDDWDWASDAVTRAALVAGVAVTVVSSSVGRWLRSITAFGSVDSGTASNGQSSNSKNREVTAYHFDIPAVPPGFEPITRYSESAGPA